MTSVGFRSLALATILTWGCSQAPQRVEFAPRQAFSPSELASLLPTRVLRLSNTELEQSASALLETEVALSFTLPPDIRVDGYTRNTNSSVSPLWGSRWRQIATELGQEYVRSHSGALQCEEQARTKCARAFINDFGERALHRPLSKNELEQLFSIYETALDLEGDHPRALGWVIGALLISPSFIYVSEAGLPTGHNQVRYLSNSEVAAVLSYMLRGKPPDDELLRAARHGELLSPEARQDQARRLLSQSDTRYHFRRFVHEWLEIDGIESTSKDESVSAHYEVLKSSMLAETSAFVDEVFVHRGASLASLLTAGFSSVDQKMARHYGLDAWGPRVPSQQVGRSGVLQHASFLSTHAHPDGTSPIKRGDFILRRILCVDIPRPEEIGIEVLIPAVTETTTTRERFSAHVSAPGCASCHDIIDPLGYAFEQFDAVGKHRTSENGKPLVTAGTFEHEGFSASFSGSDDLTFWLAEQSEAARCFRSHALRFFTSGGHEEHLLAFQELIEQAPSADGGDPAGSDNIAENDNLLANLVAYAGSDLFLYRRVEE